MDTYSNAKCIYTDWPSLPDQAINVHPVEIEITCFGAYFYSAGLQHGTVHQLPVTMSRVTGFVLWTDTRTSISHSGPDKHQGGVCQK